MNEIVKATIPMETLMELLRKEAELEAMKSHLALEIETEAGSLLYKEKIAKICSIPLNKKKEGGVS
nr:MAG TPA: hypothetical protein [Bacteriophage sp.]